MNLEQHQYPTQLINRNIATFLRTPSIEKTTDHPEELEYVLRSIPTMEQVRKTPTEKVVGVVKERPFAMDLADELRKVRAMKVFGDNPEAYWQFFKAQSEYYANEAYAKLGTISYEHQLVNDQGNLRLWIEPMGKSARESYEEAGLKGGPDWYVKRCNKETDQIDDWERQTQQYLSNKVLIDISPAPFDVPKEKLKGTMFGDHSFVRASQMVYDEHGVPYVYSRAFRTYLPPTKLEEVMQMTTGQTISASELLGTMLPLHEQYQITDIRDDRAAIQLQSILNSKWEELLPEGRAQVQDEYITSYEEMQQHYKNLVPALRAVFDQIIQDKHFDEDENVFLLRLVDRFRTWEKMVQAKVSGDWDRQTISHIEESVSSRNILGIDSLMSHMYYYYQQQEYTPGTNACGTGSGASVSSSISSALQGTSIIFGSPSTYESMSIHTSVDKSVKISCPSCKKAHEYNIASVRRAGRLTCKCGASTNCWEPIIASALKKQTR